MAKTANEIIDTILRAVPGAPLPETVDVFKAGDPNQEVTGIVTTFIATLDVLRKVVASSANLVITHEPTFYDHWDKVDWLAEDPVYQAKKQYIDDHGIIIWRFHDHWHMHVPDGILTGLIITLGWSAYQDAEIAYLFNIPPTPFGELVTFLKGKLAIPMVKVGGATDMTCQRAAILMGSGPGEWQINSLGRLGADVVVCGETVEWQVCEYVRDAVAAGLNKAMIIVGHERSEEDGMGYLVEWLRPKLPGIPITHIPAGDPVSIQ
jgi:putative NIF3 family GTP cyclohydrolase 1 type 2